MTTEAKKKAWPYSTQQELIDAGYTFQRRTRCKGARCHAVVEFWKTPKGKLIPLDDNTLQPHFASCVDLKEFRK